MEMRVPDTGKSEHKGKSVAELIATRPDWIFLTFESDLESLKKLLAAVGPAFWGWVGRCAEMGDVHSRIRERPARRSHC